MGAASFVALGQCRKWRRRWSRCLRRCLQVPRRPMENKISSSLFRRRWQLRRRLRQGSSEVSFGPPRFGDGSFVLPRELVCPWGLVFLAGFRFAGGGFPFPVGLFGSLHGRPMQTCCWAAAARRWWHRLLLPLMFAGVVAATSGRCTSDGGGCLVGGGQIRQRRRWHRRLRR